MERNELLQINRGLKENQEETRSSRSDPLAGANPADADQTALRCFPLMREVLSGQGVRKDKNSINLVSIISEIIMSNIKIEQCPSCYSSRHSELCQCKECSHLMCRDCKNTSWGSWKCPRCGSTRVKRVGSIGR